MADLIGLTNAVTDVVVNVTANELTSLGLKKNAFNGFLSDDDKSWIELTQFVCTKNSVMVPGGAPGNVIRNAAKLGLETSLMMTVGNDHYGQDYANNLNRYGVRPLPNKVDGASGVCYIFVTPDGERTIVACRGIAGLHNHSSELLNGHKVFYTSGYELDSNPKKVIELIACAKAKGLKVSFDVAFPRIDERVPSLDKILQQTDMLFISEEELNGLSSYRKISAERMLDWLASKCEIVALKNGAKGSKTIQGGATYNIPAYPVEIANTNGAGDAYAAGFLFAHARGFRIEECGRMGSFVASLVCGINEPCLQ